MTEDEMIKKASKHFTGWCARNGLRVQQPSLFLSWAREGVVFLANVNGELARYSYDHLRSRMRPWSLFGNDRTPDGRRIH